MRREGVQLSDKDLELLMERTEGWAAGLRLAALTLAEPRPARRARRRLHRGRAGRGRLPDRRGGRPPAGRGPAVHAVHVRLPDVHRGPRGHADQAGQRRADPRPAGTNRHPHQLDPRVARTLPLPPTAPRLPACRARPAPALGRQRAAPHGGRLVPRRGRPAASDGARRRRGATTTSSASWSRSSAWRRCSTGRSQLLRRVLDTAPAHVRSRPSVALIAAAAALDVGDVLDRGPLPARHRATPPSRCAASGCARCTPPSSSTRARLHGDVADAMTALRHTRAGQTGDPDVDLFGLLNHGVAAAWTGRHQTAKTTLRRRAAAGRRRTGGTRPRCSARRTSGRSPPSRATWPTMGDRARAALAVAESRGWTGTARCAYPNALLAVEAYQRLEEEPGRSSSPPWPSSCWPTRSTPPSSCSPAPSRRWSPSTRQTIPTRSSRTCGRTGGG